MHLGRTSEEQYCEDCLHNHHWACAKRLAKKNVEMYGVTGTVQQSCGCPEKKVFSFSSNDLS